MLDTSAPASGYATTVTLVTGLAWPLIAGTMIVIFKPQIAELLCVLTKRLSHAQSFKVGPVEISGMFDAAEEKTKASLNLAPAPPPDIPVEQAKVSEQLEEQLDSRGVPLMERLPIAKLRLTRLARDYDELRAEATPGEYRTKRMNEIAGLMRTFALPGIPLLPQLSASSSPGERLAAIAILQIKSLAAYIPWLQSRFAEENQAFILYNTSLALRRMARLPEFKNDPQLAGAISFGLQRVTGFEGGAPDANTIDVLEDAQAFLR